MNLALEIIKREIAQRELANKHDHLRKDICTQELQELNEVVNLLAIHNVVGQSEQLVCGDLINHNFSLSKIGICYECKFIKDRAK